MCNTSNTKFIFMSNLLEQASLVMIPSGYKEDVVYSEIPLDGSGDLSFSRASNGTRVNSAGLVEVCPWNLVTYSNDFASSWPLIESSKSTGFTDPVGNSNAIKLNYTTVSSSHYIRQGITLGGSNAHSVYAKAGELQFLQIASAQSIDEYANFNLSTGVIGTYGSLASNVQIENVGNGWYRCSVVFTNGSVGIYCAIVQSASSDWFGVSVYAGANNTNGLYLYGGQVNTGTLKPYFPTTDRLNVPRLTYQNGGGGCPSLLLEKQSTNLMTYSEEFDNAAWSKYLATVTANNATSPDGTQNADLIYPSTSGAVAGQLFRQVSSGISLGDVVTVSAFVKASGKNFAYIAEITGSFSPAAFFNLTTGAITNISAGVTASMTDVSNGWWRISITSTAGVGLYYTVIGSTDSAGNNTNTVSGTNGILVWGAQCEVSSYATSYIPTTSSSATRVADACSKTGISSLIGQTEGTLFLDFEKTNNDNTGTGGYFRIDVNDGTTSNRILFGFDLNKVNATVIASGSVVALIETPTTRTQERIKAAISYKANDFVLYVNGVQIGTDTSGAVPSNMANFQWGVNQSTPTTTTGIVNEQLFFKTRLTNAELASLTTL